MSDIEDNWVPNGRPQSTLARSFSAALDDAFKLDGDLDDLSKAVEYKKRNVTSRQSELEALEAKIRETEERLKEKTSRSSSPISAVKNSSGSKPFPRNSPQRRSGLRGLFDISDEDLEEPDNKNPSDDSTVPPAKTGAKLPESESEKSTTKNNHVGSLGTVEGSSRARRLKGTGVTETFLQDDEEEEDQSSLDDGTGIHKPLPSRPTKR